MESDDRTHTVCPIMSFQTHQGELLDCHEESCGWWDDQEHSCAILVAAIGLRKLSAAARELDGYIDIHSLK